VDHDIAGAVSQLCEDNFKKNLKPMEAKTDSTNLENDIEKVTKNIQKAKEEISTEEKTR
jgi:outer membrane murein-binding lipoprotein Lpp